jgi:hypothetical protein
VPILPVIEAQAIIAQDTVQDLRAVLPIAAAMTLAIIAGRNRQVISLLLPIGPVGFYE